MSRGIPCVFLIGEIDVLANDRSDAAEMEELERLVNVLLLELERWPTQSLTMSAKPAASADRASDTGST